MSRKVIHLLILVMVDVYKEITFLTYLSKTFSVVGQELQKPFRQLGWSKVHMFYMIPLKQLLKVKLKLQSRTYYWGGAGEHNIQR